MIATAESCTGGLVSAALTAIAGSSDVFDRGFVTYSNEAKQEMLGVPRRDHRKIWRGERGVCARHGRRRAAPFARRYRRFDHRDCRTRRRHAAKAGRPVWIRLRDEGSHRRKRSACILADRDRAQIRRSAANQHCRAADDRRSGLADFKIRGPAQRLDRAALARLRMQLSILRAAQSTMPDSSNCSDRLTS